MTWFALTFLAVIFRAVFGVMTKVLSNSLQVSVYTQTVLLTFSGLILVVFFSPLLGGISWDFLSVNPTLLMVLVASQGVGNVLYFKGISYLTNSTTQLVFSSIVLFNTIFSLLFLGLHLSLLNALGIFILLVAIVSVVHGNYTFHLQGVFFMLLSAFSFSLFQLSSSQIATQLSTGNYLLLTFLGSGITVALVFSKAIIADISHVNNYTQLLKIPLLTALPSVSYHVASYYAYQRASEPTKVAILLSMQVVFGVVLSMLYLSEREHVLRKLVAAIMVFIAAAFIRM